MYSCLLALDKLGSGTCRTEHYAVIFQVIMYDEPTAGLDPVASTVVEDLIRSLQVARETGQRSAAEIAGVASYIVVTHQHSTIRRAVDRLVFLHQVCAGTAGVCKRVGSIAGARVSIWV